MSLTEKPRSTEKRPTTGKQRAAVNAAEESEAPRAGLGITLLSVWGWFAFGACVVIWAVLMPIVWLVTWPFDRARWWTGYLYRKMPVAHQKLNPLWHFSVTGTMPENPRNPYVVVSNHESFVDILLISHLPWEMKWLSKVEMFKLPIAGWLMRLSQDIPLERGDRDSAGKAMELCKVALDRKVSVMIFPEGTRSETGEMRKFKDGAFRLAIEAQVPILPLTVSGTRSALRKHDWRFGRADAEVRVLAPISTEGLTLDDVDELREKTRALIEAQREAMRTGACFPECRSFSRPEFRSAGVQSSAVAAPSSAASSSRSRGVVKRPGLIPSLSA